MTNKGFTLAELLIALAILGEIATFTIPKVISAQQSGMNNAKAKEVAGMFSSAYQKARLDGITSSATSIGTLTPYLNYVAADNASVVDNIPGYTSQTCGAVNCIRLHNGGIVWYFSENFGGTTTTNVIRFTLDPDGLYSGSSVDSANKSVQFLLYYNGRVSTYGVSTGTATSSGGLPSGSNANDPSWFSW